MIEKQLINKKLQEVIAEQGLTIGLYHQVVPQGKSFPAITYKQVSQNPEYCKGGKAIDETRMQVDVYDKDDAKCAEIAQLIRDKIDLFTGVFEGVNFQYTTTGNQSESYDYELNLHRITRDFILRRTYK